MLVSDRRRFWKISGLPMAAMKLATLAVRSGMNGLCRIAAAFLDLPDRRVADAIDRKERRIGPADQTRQRGQVFFNAAVMRK